VNIQNDSGDDRIILNLLSPGPGCSIVLSEVKLEAIPFFPGPRPYNRQHAHWLQRRNSLSSQHAVFPSNYHSFNSRLNSRRPLSSDGSLSRPVLNPGASLARSFYNMDTVAEVEVSPISSPRRVSSLSLTSVSRSSLLSLRLARHADVQLIPDRFRITSSSAAIARGDLSEPAWSPALRHEPLDADPDIRALSSGYKAPAGTAEDLENIPLNRPKSKPTLSVLAPEHTMLGQSGRVDLLRPSPVRHRQHMLRSRAYIP